MNMKDFMTLIDILIRNGVHFEMNNIANQDGDVVLTIMIYEQDIEMVN